jgi:hypothetical protein
VAAPIFQSFDGSANLLFAPSLLTIRRPSRAKEHGVLLVPHEVAAALPAAAEKLIEREQALIRWVRSDDFSAEKLGERRRLRH